MIDPRQEAQRIEVRREIAPTPVTFIHAIMLGAFLFYRFWHLSGVLCALLSQRNHSIKHAADTAFVNQPCEEISFKRAWNNCDFAFLLRHPFSNTQLP